MSASVSQSAQDDVDLPLHLLDIIYDDLVRVRLADYLPESLTGWVGADCIRLAMEGSDISLAEEALLPLRSMHDDVRRGHLHVSWPDAACVDGDCIRRLRAVSRHIATALAYRAELIDTRRRSEVFADGLDRLSVGAMIVQENGQPIDANRAARRILDQRDGLSVMGGKICASVPADQKAMRRLMDAVLTGKVAQGGMQLQRPSGEPDLYILFLRRRPLQGVMRPGLRILLRDPLAGALHSRAALASLYGLTTAEAAITLELSNGRPPEEVEEMLAIRHNTMRAHLRAIYAKLGVSSHAALVFAVLTGGGALAYAENASGERLESLPSVVGEPR